MTTSTITKTKIEQNIKIKEPKLYKVIYMNDDTTTVEFVIDSLIDVFDFDYQAAINITEVIHEEGSAVVAVYPYEIAEQKGIEVTQRARNQGFPLVIKLEPDA